MDVLWECNEIQFPRLLAEIRAVGLTPRQYRELGESMGLCTCCEIPKLLERAEKAWELIKAGLPPPP